MAEAVADDLLLGWYEVAKITIREFWKRFANDFEPSFVFAVLGFLVVLFICLTPNPETSPGTRSVRWIRWMTIYKLWMTEGQGNSSKGSFVYGHVMRSCQIKAIWDRNVLKLF